MKKRNKRIVSIILIVTILVNIFSSCSLNDDKEIKNDKAIKFEEKLIDEKVISEVFLKEDYIREHIIFEDGVYEYTIDENTVAEAYIIEAVVGETTEEEILAQLPDELDDYEIEWQSVISKFAIGTSIIIAVGIVNYISGGSTFFVSAAPLEIAKEALIGAAIGAILNLAIGGVKDGKLTNESVKKYAIEGIAEGYMWGAISSVLKVSSDNIKKLKAFKRAKGDKFSVNLKGEVFDDAGALVGRAYNDKNGFWRIVNEVDGVVECFDKKGKFIALEKGKNFLPNRTYRSGETIVRTDDNGNIYKISDLSKRLLPNNSYALKGFEYKTDSKGRIVDVAGRLKEKTMGRKKFTIKDTLKDIAGENIDSKIYDRGHIIADVFDGDNSIANLVAMSKKVNRGEYKKFELQALKAIRNGEKVNVEIKIIYKGSSKVPEKFEILHNVKSIKNKHLIIPNK